MSRPLWLLHLRVWWLERKRAALLWWRSVLETLHARGGGNTVGLTRLERIILFALFGFVCGAAYSGYVSRHGGAGLDVLRMIGAGMISALLGAVIALLFSNHKGRLK